MGQIKAKIGLTAPKIALFLAVGDRGRFRPRQPLVYQLKALPFAWFSYHHKDSSTWFLFPLQKIEEYVFFLKLILGFAIWWLKHATNCLKGVFFEHGMSHRLKISLKVYHIMKITLQTQKKYIPTLCLKWMLSFIVNIRIPVQIFI